MMEEGPSDKIRLIIDVWWDEDHWLAGDNIWAWATGASPEQAVAACFAEARKFVTDVDETGGRDTLAGPALAQYDRYAAFFGQGTGRSLG